MNKNSRTKKSFKNLIFSFACQFVILIVNFIARTIFIQKLGEVYLGINGLFTNILMLFSLTELGIENALIYCLYKPIYDNDQERISSIIQYYKKIYRYVICIVLILGVIIFPLLPFIVKVDINTIQFKEINTYYFLFLINTCCSYAFAYKSGLIMADQKMYIIKVVNLLKTIIQFVLQSIVLILFKSFILFLSIQILCTLLYNLTLYFITNKYYYFIKHKNVIDNETKSLINNNIKNITINKFFTVFVDNVDNILISSFVGVVLVGIYSNYHLIINAVLSVVIIIFFSISASVGNLGVESDTNKKEKVFSEVMLLNSFIMIFCSLCLYFCIDDFIYLWIGENYVLTKNITAVIVFNFYVFGVLIPINIYKDSSGLFYEGRKNSVVLAILNLLLSLLLGYYFGMFGILISTCISKMLTTLWYIPYKLYKKEFNKSSFIFFKNQIKNLVVIIVCVLISTVLFSIINEVSYISLMLRCIIIFILTTIIFILFNLKNENLKNLINRFFQILTKKP